MSERRVRFHPAAAEELAAAVDWYEQQDAELGVALIEEVERALATIRSRPAAWSVSPLDPRARHFRLARFPYRVVYTHEADEIVVVAIAHTRRRPGYWRAR